MLRIAAVVCMVVAIIVAGCRSESEQPLGVYLAALESTEDVSRVALDEAFAEYNSAIAQAQANDEIVDAFRQVLRDIQSITEQNYGDVGSIVPPPEVEQLHDDALRARADVIVLLLDLKIKADLAESSSDVEELLIELDSGPELSAARERIQEVVCAIQAVGAESGSDVEDIGCEE